MGLNVTRSPGEIKQTRLKAGYILGTQSGSLKKITAHVTARSRARCNAVACSWATGGYASAPTLFFSKTFSLVNASNAPASASSANRAEPSSPNLSVTSSSATPLTVTEFSPSV